MQLPKDMETRLNALADERFPLDGVHAAKKRIGILSGRLHVPDDFDAPLPDEIAQSFHGGSS